MRLTLGLVPKWNGNTSLKAVICICILFTNLHCITRLRRTGQNQANIPELKLM